MKKRSILSRQIKYFIYLGISLILFSCGSKKDLIYFQNVDTLVSSKSINSYNPTFKPDDALTINVSALDLDAVRPFNLPAVSYVQ